MKNLPSLLIALAAILTLIAVVLRIMLKMTIGFPQTMIGSVVLLLLFAIALDINRMKK